MDRICALARSPDPERGRTAVRLSGDDDERLAQELEGTAINCTRGVAAGAIAGLLVEQPELRETLRDTCEGLAEDDHPAVRVAALDIAVALAAASKSDGVNYFLRAVSGTEEQVLITDSCHRMLSWALGQGLAEAEAVVERMCHSQDAAVARHGSAHVTMVSVGLGGCLDCSRSA